MVKRYLKIPVTPTRYNSRLRLYRAEQMGLSIIYLSNWKLCGGNFRSIAHYTWQQLTHPSVARIQLWINATWTGRDTREIRRDGGGGGWSAYAPLRAYTRGRIYVNVFISRIDEPRPSARKREMQPHVAQCRRTNPRCERALKIGTQVPATRPRTCVRAYVRAWADNRRWTLFADVRGVLRCFPRRKRSRSGKRIALALICAIY